MSADNGIYIGHFDDGYRVIYAQAIENIYEEPKYMLDYFGQTAVLPTLEEAYSRALLLDRKLKKEAQEDGWPYILEYGIQILELGKYPAKTERKNSQ